MTENLYCSGHIGSSEAYRENYSKIKWKPILDIVQKDKASPGPPQGLVEDFKEDIKEDIK